MFDRGWSKGLLWDSRVYNETEQTEDYKAAAGE